MLQGSLDQVKEDIRTGGHGGDAGSGGDGDGGVGGALVAAGGRIGEWWEARVYAVGQPIDAQFPLSLYKSLRIVFYEQDKNDGDWVMSLMQVRV